MLLKPLMQCDKRLDFNPRKNWPEVLPAIAWRGFLLCGFQRERGEALDLGESHLIEVLKSCHPELGLAELTRFLETLKQTLPVEHAEFHDPCLQAYGLRPSDRLRTTLQILAATSSEFQTWVDEKKLGPRDLAPLLALPKVEEFLPFVNALVQLPMTKSEGVRALELGVELFMLGRPLNDLLPSVDSAALYLHRLEKWRQPRTQAQDESWRDTVSQWPWPAQTQAHWQRVGDEGGIEIKIRTTSPHDFLKKLERLESIRETWSCKS